MADLPFHFFPGLFLLCSRREKCRYSCELRNDPLENEPAEGGFEDDGGRFALGGGLMARIAESAFRFIFLYRQPRSSDTTKVCSELVNNGKTAVFPLCRGSVVDREMCKLKICGLPTS